ncbi:MAG: hypothetical protein LBT86_09250 [Deltaproteobacteria bacterium]|nr:hypothetical protein [Deltaproteobacteria bacterium]
MTPNVRPTFKTAFPSALSESQGSPARLLGQELGTLSLSLSLIRLTGPGGIWLLA